jgi:lysophospholipase L1-like esterase
VQYDEDLVYKPREGTCLFENAEFSTIVSFGKEGRGTNPKPEGVGIAVLGDSHAMGWGVNDHETFSAELERLSGRPVYNLAVSSYGTARELLRLQKSDLIALVDTIVIQYCENDLRENVEFRPRSTKSTQEVFQSILKARERSPLADLRYILRGYAFSVKAPLVAWSWKRRQQESYDFSVHYAPLIATLSRYESLDNKRIIVLYTNEHGKPFSNFPVGKDRQMSHVEFVEVQHAPQDFYPIDGHLTRTGHQSVARQLMEVIGPPPLRRSSGPSPLTRSPAASAAARWKPA